MQLCKWQAELMARASSSITKDVLCDTQVNFVSAFKLSVFSVSLETQSKDVILVHVALSFCLRFKKTGVQLDIVAKASAQ